LVAGRHGGVVARRSAGINAKKWNDIRAGRPKYTPFHPSIITSLRAASAFSPGNPH
jgi:hypothetical protein